MRVNLWEKSEEERLAAEQNTVTARMMKRIGSIHIPDGLALPGAITGTGKTSGRSSPTSDDDSRGARPASTNRSRLPHASGGSSTSNGASGAQAGKPPAAGAGVLGGVLRMGKTPTKN